MAKRKTIACIGIRLEEMYQKRVMTGLQAQCERYGYNLAVFAPLVPISHFRQEYLEGEMNILNLPDFTAFDAVIIMTIPLLKRGDDSFIRNYCKKIRSITNIPIVTLDYDIEGCIPVHTDDITDFYNITRHVIDEHACQKIYMLAGQQDNPVSDRRISGYRKAMEESGILSDVNTIFYGDFWYDSGRALAEKIISGEVEMPEAVVCAGDHQAIGLANKLIQAGIQVPKQIIVTGYEANAETITNDIGITTYTPAVSAMSARAVEKIRQLIEPDKEQDSVDLDAYTGLVIGESCGCKQNMFYQKRNLRTAVYMRNRDYQDESIVNIDDLANLMENYMLENLTKSESPMECLVSICGSTYLIAPHDHLYLCLRPDWLDTESMCIEGYPKKMRCVTHTVLLDNEEYAGAEVHCRNDSRDEFDSKLMLPQLWDEWKKPGVFYFSPVHFSNNTLGYLVLYNNLEQRLTLTQVFHQWVRNVNNALEMIRIRNNLLNYSLSDGMTKLCNRRGFFIRGNDLLRATDRGAIMLAMVMDMDDLKHVNDIYGHNEGDYAITAFASVVRCSAENGEIASRAGGDEFYILGVGQYTDETVEKKIERFYAMLDDQNKSSMKPYKITGSVGYHICSIEEVESINDIIAIADSRMYENKIRRKNGGA